MSRVTIRIEPERLVPRLVGVCIAAAFLLFCLDFAINESRLVDSGPIRRLFNLTREDGLGGWFATLLAAAIAATAWAIRGLVGRVTSQRGRRAGWTALAVLFTWLAIDDGAKVHERLGSVGGDVSGFVEGFVSYGWHVVVAPVLFGAGALAAFFLWREFATRGRRIMLAAALVATVLAFGLDFVEGLEADDPRNPYARLGRVPAVESYAARQFDERGYDAVLHFSKTAEEAIEITGAALLWGALLLHLAGLAEAVRFDLAPRREGTSDGPS